MMTQLAAISSALVVADINGRIGAHGRPGLLLPAPRNDGPIGSSPPEQQSDPKRPRTTGWRETTSHRGNDRARQDRQRPTHASSNDATSASEARGSAPKHCQQDCLIFSPLPEKQGYSHSFSRRRPHGHKPCSPLHLRRSHCD